MKKNYDRYPVIISNHACLVIHVFKRTDYLEDIWMHDVDGKYENDIDTIKQSAEQLIDQLEGSYCDYFLQELINVCQNKLNKS